jgi:hypothetical protein
MISSDSAAIIVFRVQSKSAPGAARRCHIAMRSAVLTIHQERSFGPMLHHSSPIVGPVEPTCTTTALASARPSIKEPVALKVPDEGWKISPESII